MKKLIGMFLSVDLAIIIFLIILRFIPSFPYYSLLRIVGWSTIGALLLVSVILGFISFHNELPFDTLEIGIDAFGQKYNEANCYSWFFSHLNQHQKETILKRVYEIKQWKEQQISKCKNDKQRYRVMTKYHKCSQIAFLCFIYRRQTRYMQSNYVKTPYTGYAIYWKQYCTLETMESYVTLR